MKTTMESKMKIGDLIKWKEDGVIGVILEIKKGWDNWPLARVLWPDGEIIGRLYCLKRMELLDEPS